MNKNLNYTVICIYRPPNTNMELFNQEIEILLNKTTSKNKSILLGDFNINILNTETHQPTANFNNILITCKFLPTINKPTRITEISSTLIDNIYTNIPLETVNSAIIYHALADHLPILISINSKPALKDTIIKHNHRKIDEYNTYLFLEKLKRENWESAKKACKDNQTDLAFTTFHQIFTKYYNEAFPIIKISHTTNKMKQPWMTTAFLNSVKNKSKLL